LDKFKGIVNADKPFPLTFLEMWSFAELTAELSTACYAGMLMLQAIGLGGWIFRWNELIKSASEDRIA
jgi:hypothetical protein